MSWLLFFTGSNVWLYEGAVSFSMGPQSSYGYAFPPYQGDIDVEIQPASPYSMEHGYQGQIGLSLLPQGQGQIEHAETGNVLITFHTLRTIHFADYVYQGNIGLALSPASPSVHDFPPVIGMISVAFTPASASSLESIYAGAILVALTPNANHFADYPYQGGFIVAVIPNSSHFADFPYQGSIVMAVMPASSYSQNFEYLAQTILSLLPGSTFIEDFGFSGNVILRMIPEAEISRAGFEKVEDFDGVLLRSLLTDAQISKNLALSADGLSQVLNIDAFISKTLRYETKLRRVFLESDDLDGYWGRIHVELLPNSSYQLDP